MTWLFPGDDAGTRASLILGLLLVATAVAMVAAVVWRLAGPGPALLGGIVAVHGPVSIISLNQRMECPVVLVALAGLRYTADIGVRQGGTSPEVWACTLLLVLLATDFFIDIVLAPNWYSAPQRLAFGFVLGGAI